MYADMYVLINKLTAMIFAPRRKEFCTNIQVSVRDHRLEIFLRVKLLTRVRILIRIRILIEFTELKSIELHTNFRKKYYGSI